MARKQRSMVSKPTDASPAPGTFRRIVKAFPAIAAAHEQMARAVDSTGPLDRATCELIKIGICVGAGLESALRSHVRRAIQAGATQVSIQQAIFLGMTTVGFPRATAAWSWARQQFERDEIMPPTRRRRTRRNQ